MPRDARLGFVVGVALVILIAVIFYHGDGRAGVAGNVGSAAPGPALPRKLTPPPTTPVPQVRSHVVREGETLMSLAQHYYGDATRYDVLFRANRSQLRAPDQVAIGMVLLIPDLAAK